MKVKIRVKNQYMNIGYIESRTVEVSDSYEAKKFVDKELELCKIGDDKWHKVDQEFDCNSEYLTDGYYVRWYEFII